MKKWIKSIGIGVLAAGVVLGTSGGQSYAGELITSADANLAGGDGFRVLNGKTYYYQNGRRVKGWLTLKGKRYYLNPKTGVLYRGWLKSSKGAKRYFDVKTGEMKRGFTRVQGKWYYFEPKTGWSRKGFWTAKSGNVRYFKSTTRAMMTGWVRNAKGEKRYFQPASGIMCKGLKKVQGKWYYFDPDRGAAGSGWITDQDGNRRYFDPKTFVMASGEQIIDGKNYTFDEKGVGTLKQDKWNQLLETYEKDTSTNQLIFVQYQGGSNARVILYEKENGSWKEDFSCQGYVGGNGVDKVKEGDRKTPAGVFGFTKAFGIKDNPGAKLPYTKLNPYLYWCGDKQWYNTLVDVRETPHECSGEHLISYVPHYNYVLAIDYNPECTFGKGSAIFLHCAGSNPYTGGCVAVSESNMIRIMQTVDKGAKICIYPQ